MPDEKVPDAAPLPLFFLPNFLGVLFAYAVEAFRVEERLQTLLPTISQPNGLLGLGIFALYNVNSFLAGSVVNAKAKYGVKNPNLYALKSENKDAVAFNVIQRGHQNFLEQLPHIILSTWVISVLVERPNVAGLLLLIIGAARILYALAYRSSDIQARIGPMLLSQFSMAVGIGYSALLGLSIIGVKAV